MRSNFLNSTVLTGFLLISCTALAHAQGWIKVQAIDSTDILSVAAHNGSLYATSYDTVFKSSDGGDTWQPTATQPNSSSDFYTLFDHSGYLYLGTLGDGIFRSSNGGQSWQSYNTGLPGGGGSIVGLTALGDSLYAGTGGNGVYVRNLQTPGSWTAFNTGLFQFGVNAISTSGNNLVASVGFYLFVRSRTAAQWTDVYVDSFGVQRQVFETLANGQHLYAGTDNGVYRGDLDAQNWERIDIAAFPNRDIVALTAHGSRLIVALSYFGQHWIFSTDDMGATWDFRAHEFAEAWDLFVSGNRLWAGRSDGLWYMDISVWTDLNEPAPNKPSGFDLSQNYPNPFNPKTTIAYEIPQAGHVTLKVFDLQGRQIATLVDAYQNTGRFEVTFDGSRLASGVYVYQLLMDGRRISRKMILTK